MEKGDFSHGKNNLTRNPETTLKQPLNQVQGKVQGDRKTRHT
mgnify:CR=1 FL=1